MGWVRGGRVAVVSPMEASCKRCLVSTLCQERPKLLRGLGVACQAEVLPANGSWQHAGHPCLRVVAGQDRSARPLKPRNCARNALGVSPASRRKNLTKLVASLKPRRSPISAMGSTECASKRLASSIIRFVSTVLAFRSVTISAARVKLLAAQRDVACSTL